MKRYHESLLLAAIHRRPFGRDIVVAVFPSLPLPFPYLVLSTGLERYRVFSNRNI